LNAGVRRESWNVRVRGERELGYWSEEREVGMLEGEERSVDGGVK